MVLERLVECVPNFSEGRDAELLRSIASAIQSVPGVYVLDEERDEDHNRAVMTVVGEPTAMLEAMLNAAALAVERIDLTRHQGVHPRIGALDVLPFIPLSGISMAECVQLAREAAQRLWERHQVPCYLYEAAAATAERRNLETIRKGQFEHLRLAVEDDPSLRPDVGGPGLHPTAGATAVGARKFLIAWNVWLRTDDLSVAQRIAKLIRQSSGGFPFVKALGLPLPRRGLTQVSLNLTDFEETPPQPVFDTIVREAAKHKVEVIGSELIGLVPHRALEVNFRESLQLMDFRQASILENRLDALRQGHSHLQPAQAQALRREDPTGLVRETRVVAKLAAQVQRAGELLAEAVALAESREGPSGGTDDFDWRGEALECQRFLEQMQECGEGPGWAGTATGPAQRLAGETAMLAEKAVSLLTRLAGERNRLLEDAAAQDVMALTSTVRHLLSAGLHLLLLAAGGLFAELPMSEAEALREKLRPIRQLLQTH
ncbi:MAG: glutamate formimidoyltransferase [Bryobacterales bacterium]|nr:glutamate formimidoyltransferase [Bryobacterales bacterium]